MDMRERFRKHGALGFERWFLIKRVGRGILVATDRFFARQSLVGDPPVIDGRAQRSTCGRVQAGFSSSHFGLSR